MRTITGLFDSRPEAERAVETLVQEHGIDRARVQVHAAGAENATAGTHEQRSESHHGFLASAREKDRARYGEGLRRGGILVSAEVPDEQAHTVSAVLTGHGAADLDAREAAWRADGWTGGGGLIGGKSAGSGSTPDSLPAVNADAAEGGWTGGGAAIGSTAATRETAAPEKVGSTYAGSHRMGARSTDEDITKPVNAGVASSPAVRPAGPAALAAAAPSTSARRSAAADAERAASMGNDGPGTGEGPAAGSAAAGDAPLPDDDAAR
ncbi:hypothetical protein ACFQS7_15655 [Dankookia sp. GCM10030260]|uniref:hypothetical protein n=1 Tax=Dankookia sp. GCM10030260 TaxID=3273390 RepID=UPI0036060078